MPDGVAELERAPSGDWLLVRKPDGTLARVTAASWRSVYAKRGYELVPPGEEHARRIPGPPRLLAHIHQAAGEHNAGAEWYLHTVLRYMQRAGAEIRVVIRNSFEGDGFEGVPYFTERDVIGHYHWADVVITHLDLTERAICEAARTGRPLVHIVHNDQQLRANHVRGTDAALVVFNSEWIAREVAWPGPQIIVRPPVVAEDYRTTPGDAITLVNVTAAKGADTFLRLARMMPERRFLGVLGSYGRQRFERLPNVTYRSNAPDMREVYAQTRIVLMPSDYESWGRVGIEAAASGIPTIAHPTPGLRESLSYAGIFRDRDRPADWAAAIRGLDEPRRYGRARAAALRRSAELDPTEDLERLRLALWERAGIR